LTIVEGTLDIEAISDMMNRIAANGINKLDAETEDVASQIPGRAINRSRSSAAVAGNFRPTHPQPVKVWIKEFHGHFLL